MPHVVGTCIGGDYFYVLCEHCTYRAGPFADEWDADVVALLHEEYTQFEPE